MPKSKRNQKVSLTKTKRKGLENKQNVISEIRLCAKKYNNIFVFSYSNMRNKFMQEIRLKYRDNSRFFFGKNRVMALALGRTSAEEVAENVHLVSEKLCGDRGLMFTNTSKDDVLSYFDSLQIPEFARSGCIAPKSFEIPEGLLGQFSHTLEPHLRSLGLPSELRKGIPALYKPYLVCKEGEVLTPEKAKILKLFGEKMTTFKITMEFSWSNDGSFDDFGRTSDVIFVKKKSSKRPNRQSKGKGKLESNEEQVDSNSEGYESEKEGSSDVEMDQEES